MDLSVDEFLEGLFKEGTVEIPADNELPKPTTMQLPPWYNEKKYKQGVRFFWDNCYSIGVGTFFGLVAVFAVPSILNVLIGTKRSNSAYTAYKRYVATFLLVVSWFEHDLKPGSVSWKSLYVVRRRHFVSSGQSKKKGIGIISQRDMSLTQFGLFGFSFLNASRLGVQAKQPGDWEAFTHCWRTIGYLLGIEDKYNLCRKTVEETRDVFKAIECRVYRPCLTIEPEYFIHMSQVMLDGMGLVNPISNTSVFFYCKYLANVPGYILEEDERIQFKRTLKEYLKGKCMDEGVPSTALIAPSAVEGLPDREPQYFFIRDYHTLSSIPSYRELSWQDKIRVNINHFGFFLARFAFFRFFLNAIFRVIIFLMKYFPFFAFLKYGLKELIVDMVKETPTDESAVQKNEEYRKLAKQAN